MEQLIIIAMQTCGEFAQKSAAMKLTEYEMLMYEQLCRTVQAYMRNFEGDLRAQDCKWKGERDDDGEITSGAA